MGTQSPSHDIRARFPRRTPCLLAWLLPHKPALDILLPLGERNHSGREWVRSIETIKDASVKKYPDDC
jgi:hypothetical protein